MTNSNLHFALYVVWRPEQQIIVLAKSVAEGTPWNSFLGRYGAETSAKMSTEELWSHH